MYINSDHDYEIPSKVICPELIREVESRMNRNYLPPALKLQQNNCVGFSQSPPNVASTPYSSNSSTTNSPAYPSVGAAAMGSTTASLVINPTVTANSAGVSYSNRRIYGKASKLPPVQEVGELFCFDFFKLALFYLLRLLQHKTHKI